jgi:hypothetical protein
VGALQNLFASGGKLLLSRGELFVERQEKFGESVRQICRRSETTRRTVKARV